MVGTRGCTGPPLCRFGAAPSGLGELELAGQGERKVRWGDARLEGVWNT